MILAQCIHMSPVLAQCEWSGACFNQLLHISQFLPAQPGQ